MNKKVKIAFDLTGTGWKIPVETVWAEQKGENKYKLLNSPFCAYGYSFDDIVSVSDKNGQLFVDGVVYRGHSTYRIFLSEKTTPEVFKKYWDPIQAMGTTYEQGTKSLYAVDVSSGADVGGVYQFLEEGEKSGVWKFEEVFYYQEP